MHQATQQEVGNRREQQNQKHRCYFVPNQPSPLIIQSVGRLSVPADALSLHGICLHCIVYKIERERESYCIMSV